jgi:hypothetical protein
MYKELQKYKTGEKIKITIKTINDNTLVILTDEYKADLGNLLNDFIEHKTKSFLRRKYYHKHLTKMYLDMLNQLTIFYGW